MKKIVKLTENDLTRIVKRVIKENDNKMSHDPSYKYFDEIDDILNYVMMDNEMTLKNIELTIDEISDIMSIANSDEDLSDDELDEIISYAGQVIMELENMFDSESPMYEQSSKNISCLLNSGYKKETIGGPMTKREVYTSKKNGMTYQISINDGVLIQK